MTLHDVVCTWRSFLLFRHPSRALSCVYLPDFVLAAMPSSHAGAHVFRLEQGARRPRVAVVSGGPLGFSEAPDTETLFFGGAH